MSSPISKTVEGEPSSERQHEATAHTSTHTAVTLHTPRQHHSGVVHVSSTTETRPGTAHSPLAGYHMARPSRSKPGSLKCLSID